MIISVTERGTFRRCRRRWDYSSFNRRSLSPATTTSGALDLGTLIHKSLADWIVKRKYTQDEADRLNNENQSNFATGDVRVDRHIDAGEEMPLVECFKYHAAARMMELQINYFKITGGAKPKADEMASFYELVELGIAMMQNYEAFHGSPLPERMAWVSPEQKVRVPIPGTTCEQCNGSGVDDDGNVCKGCDGQGCHLLEGTLDGLVQDKRDRLYILEHKTYGRRPKLETLDTADQFLAYIWILEQLNIGVVKGIAYDGMWKRAVPPKGSKLSDLFVRTVLERDKAELAEFEAQLVEEATDMGNLSKRVPIGATSPAMYMNRQWQGCSDCGYLRLCRAQSRNEDTDYIQSTYYVQRVKEDPLGVLESEPEEAIA